MANVRAVVISIMVCVGSSCTPVLSPLPPREGEIPDLPREVALVEQMGSDFSAEPDHPLSSVVLGTVVDELSNLEGCWGAYWTCEACAVTADAEFYRFNLEHMSITHQLLQRGVPDKDAVGLRTGMNFDLFQEHVSRIESIGTDHLSGFLVSERMSLSSNYPIRDFPSDSEEETTDDSGLYDLYITLDGDSLKIGAALGDKGIRANRIFTRFPCPE